MVLAGLGLLASCAAAPTPATKFSESKYGKASPKVASGKRTPKGGGQAMVGKPYTVAGKRYVPQEDPNYTAVGLASWYGPNFHGRKTANGEVFNMNDLTAAHPTLPLPSYVRVTNLKNNRSVVVRVNDRGPFSRDRVIDVSATAASMLDFKRVGVAKVKVEYVGPARMDGRDRRTLMASYSGPGKKPRTMVASRKLRKQQPAPATAPVAAPVMVASSTAPNTPPPVGPSPTGFDDPIGPLILRSGFVSSYAEPERLSDAHAAAAELGN
jgi:rare lipoprotein A